jgi:2'-5' RNA ligase
VRAFVAAFVERGAAERLFRATPLLAGMRRVPPYNLHLTLHFLGSIGDTQRDQLIAFVDALQGTPLTVRVTGVTGFPSASRARTVVAMVEAVEALCSWRDALAQAFPTGDSERRFRPHITLGRSRNGMTVPEIGELEGMEIPLLPPRAYVSRTLPEGARYLPLDEAP